MENKIIEAMAKAVVYTCMVLTGAGLIFMFAGAAVLAFNWMIGML